MRTWGLVAAAFAAVAIGVLAVALTRGGGEGRTTGSPPAAAGHDGMVKGTVWLANEGGNSLTAIDASRNEIVATLDGIEGPHNLQVSPDGGTVWAVSGHDSLAAMVDATTLELHGVVPTGKEPAHVVVTPDGRRAYATNGGDDTVTAIDVAAMKPITTIPVGRFPHGFRPSPDGKWLFVANAKGTTVSIVDVAANKRVADVEVGKSPVQVGFDPEGKFVYVSLNGEDAVAKVDVAKRRLVAKQRVGAGPIQVYVTPNGGKLLVANQGTADRPSTTLSILDLRSFDVVGTVETGKGAHGVVVDPSSRHAYVTNIYGDDVAVVDLDERRVVARIPVGREPNGISFSPLALTGPRRTVALPMPEQDDAMEDMGH